MPSKRVSPEPKTRSVILLCNTTCLHHNQWVDELRLHNWEAQIAETTEQAIHLLNSHSHCCAPIVVSCLTSSSVDKQCEQISTLKARFPSLKAIAIFKQPPSRNLSLIKQTYWDYYHLPIDTEWLCRNLGHAYGMVDTKQNKPKPASCHEYQLVGKSSTIQQLKKKITKIANNDFPVLIQGETGTGKSLCARLIHEASARCQKPFIAVNCGAIPQSLVHSELFGFEKGSFTGANKRYVGHVERANGGTLFLDEIGDLELSLQTYLLHFLENNLIERLGSNNQLTVDCRVIFATNVNIEQAVAAGKFRKDLFHRINVLPLDLVPLNDHKEDIEDLIRFELKHNYASKIKLPSDTLEQMKQYHWPGNVRELFNCIKRAIVLSNSSALSTHHMGIQLKGASLATESDTRLSSKNVRRVIQQHHYNISQSAKALSISRTTLYKLIKKHQIVI
ncbi:sigma-54-dependent Fis family transcriptional regulator [Vibrio sp. 10N.286.51.C3]|uniref:sigma-54 interaction domain-containing protein n=1 Tax=unclassified Vibrio TaxID=2614977 RepID=UPI000D37E6B5|nr:MULTISPECIES: sigma-54 dependent transcriptional regulator [unclassified Vibrio]PTP15394.1 sigma-54-dependent Fis family transcriptional regulator [Vibrio sp. 10N.286.51.C3]PTQ02720.1 sigma-54-dependent Fis family transcriptional regulator [Vibrio sp. ZF 223]TKE63543.1 sigma-54-dependent Fis family transcriptional regulator [Vibrio sp. F12]CAK3978060.1 Sigma-54-dependent Fis family transcriptional regulator [Vibrio crassostreae]